MCPLRLPAIFALLLPAVLSAGPARGDGPDLRLRKKLIETGWDVPDTARLRQNLAVMEQRPFDGVVLEAVGRIDDKRRCPMRPAFSSQPWQRQWFQSCVEDLKACRPKRLTDNFVTLGANPGDVDWFDDAGWQQIVEHWRIAAWLAKQGGLKGILFDPEPYEPPHRQFAYAAQPQRDRHTFAEYCAKARERGRQVMQAVAGEYPGMVLYCYFMNSANATAVGHADPQPILEAGGYGLYPAFIDGWLDAVPPAMTLVDGCESAYHYNSTEQFLEAGLLMRLGCQELVSPENRARYRAQVQASFGIYLDAHWNPPTSPWYIDPKGGPRADRLRENVATALRVADEYVWIYGEKFRWWPTPNGGVKPESWDEALPGSEDALRFARDPLDDGRRRIEALRQAGKLENLARNGDFGSEHAAGNDAPAQDWKAGGAPAGWGFWQEDTSKGTFTWDREAGAAGKGAARAAGVLNGCFIQQINAKPGERYAVQAVRKLQGKGNAWVRIRWQTAEGKWTDDDKDVILTATGARGEWAELFGVATVPERAGKLLILLGAGGQQSPEDVAWFDDVRLYRLGP